MRTDKLRMYGLRILMFIVCFSSPNTFRAQSQVTFRQLSVNDGLSQNSAISIAQDSTGYLWIATQDGLNKYDGRQFTVLPFTFVDITKPDYSNLGKVYTDRLGNLWIIPFDKIPRKLNSKDYDFEPLMGVDDASTIYQDSDLNIWIGTYSQGLYVLRPESSKVEKMFPYEKIGGAIYNMVQNSEGHILLAGDHKIIEFDPKIIEKTPPKLSLESGQHLEVNFSDIVVDDTGRQWIGTYGKGLYFKERGDMNFQRISDLPYTDPLPSDLNIMDLHIDSKKRLWIATYGSGLYMVHLNRHKIVHFSAEKHNPKTLHYNDILCIYEDYLGTLWFGTDGAGTSYYDEYLEKFNSLTNFETPENINIDVVRAITVDKNKGVWIGTSGKGLTRYDPASNSWQTIKVESHATNSISSNRIMSLMVDAENDLWIGTQGGGLNIKDGDGNFLHFSPVTKNRLSANTIWCIFKSQEGRIWLGTREDGLIEFDKNKGEIRKYNHDSNNPNSLPSNNIRAVTADLDGNLWIGTETDGIVFFNIETESFETYGKSTDPNSPAIDKIKSLYYAPGQTLWIGTNGGGLVAFDIQNKKFKSFTVEQGLANNVIYSILPDENQNLWLSSNKGITKFTPGDSFESSPQVNNYTNYAGLATEFNTGASYKDDEGNLYFGGLDGFYWFKPSEIEKNTTLSKTTITGFEVFDETRSLTEKLELHHDQNTVTFTFSSMQYSLPEKNQYQYKLVNYDQDWVQAGNNNFARYTQLPPGDYEFQVKSSNYDGVWNETPVTYSFSIAAPWYMTPFLKAIYLLGFFGAVFGVYRYLNWRWQMKIDFQLKEEEAQRLKKLNQLKSQLYTDISHEFRTPLTLISGPIDAKLSEGQLSDADFSNFSMIKRNTNRLVNLVDQLLHLAKLEKGVMKLKFAKGNLSLFLAMLASSFEYRALSKRIDYKVEVKNLEEGFYDADAIEKIVTNLLSNAFKYGHDGGICHFEARETEGKVCLKVKNSFEKGLNIDIEKLFTRFYQNDEYGEGAGVGLSLVKELVRLYGGKIEAFLEPGDIINFKVELPFAASAFEKNKPIEMTTINEGSAANVISENLNTSIPSLPDEEGSEEPPIVLIVEDHSEVRDFLKSVWASKYTIYEAENGKEGIQTAIEIVPDIIITDVRMPVCDGIQLCNRLKTDERTSHIPILLLTAGIDEEQELKGLRSGADDFVTKPFNLRILQTRVENLIENRKKLRSRYSQEIVLQAKDIAVTPTDEIFLNRLQKVLDDHLNDPSFNTEFFCNKIGMSRMQLHRKLLAYTGLSTTAFIRSQRLKQAVTILQTSDANVSEVAYAVGFNTPSYFIKCFKEAYNKTPSEFLQSTE